MSTRSYALNSVCSQLSHLLNPSASYHFLQTFKDDFFGRVQGNSMTGQVELAKPLENVVIKGEM